MLLGRGLSYKVTKLQSYKVTKLQATSYKLQASSYKLQATNYKLRVTKDEWREPGGRRDPADNS